jgi:hypothetical protein
VSGEAEDQTNVYRGSKVAALPLDQPPARFSFSFLEYTSNKSYYLCQRTPEKKVQSGQVLELHIALLASVSGRRTNGGANGGWLRQLKVILQVTGVRYIKLVMFHV